MSDESTAIPAGVLVPADWLTGYVARLFRAVGVPGPDAVTVAEALVDADRRGVPSHGTMLVPMYVERLCRGSVSTTGRAVAVVDLGAVAVLDAEHALGVLTADQAMALAVRKAREFGVGAVAVRHAFHFGAAGRYVRAAAAQGLVGVALANTRPLMPAPGGGRPVVGNNPVAVGLPVASGEPLVLDMALSAAAIGKIRMAAAAGREIPAGWAVDGTGRPTIDPAAALTGMLLPAAGYKGFGLAMVVDVLTGVLSGGGYGQRVAGLYADTSVPNDCAHFFLALDVAAFGDVDAFTKRLADLVESVTAPPYAPSTDRVVVPGQRSAERYRASLTDGVPVAATVLTTLRELADSLGVPVPPLAAPATATGPEEGGPDGPDPAARVRTFPPLRQPPGRPISCPTAKEPQMPVENLSEPAAYSGELPDRAAVPDPAGTPGGSGPDGSVLRRFQEMVVRTGDLEWVAKTLDGLSHKMLWRDDETGASIALVRFHAGAGIPSTHAHASNQFMFCLSGRYTYQPTGITLTPGSFYWNPKGSVHGPTLAEEESVLLEVYDGPHYPTQPEWYTSAEDAR